MNKMEMCITSWQRQHSETERLYKKSMERKYKTMWRVDVRKSVPEFQSSKQTCSLDLLP